MKSFGRLSGQPGALSHLVEVLKRLPGIGQKSAQRLALYFMKMDQQDVQGIAQAILDIKEKVSLCRECHNLSENEICGICNDPRRDRTKILVIQDLNVLYTIERTGDYKGLYHVLQGILSPLDGLGPDQFQVDDLTKRLGNGEVKEVIIATNPNIEGEATAIYLSKFVKDAGIQVSRIAYGIPVGMDLDYADEVTLIKAIEGRRAF